MIRTEIRFKNATFMNALENSKYNSIANLSRESAISVHTLYSIASLNHTNISTENQIKLAEMLNCNVYDLFEQYEEVIKKSKDYPKKLTKDIPINKMLSLSSKKVMQLESDYNIDDIDNKESLKKDMSLTLGELKDREKDVLEMHFGIGRDPMSIGEIATFYNLSIARIQQIREKAIRKLRHRLRSYRLKKYQGTVPANYESSHSFRMEYSRELNKQYKKGEVK